MPELLSCPRCQTPLSADAPDGICPECLLRQVIDDRQAEERAASVRSPAPRFVPPSPRELARHFPQLEVLELLGQGGMGAVYKARQTKLDRLVAIKILPPEVARDSAFAERFTREARSLARLNHSNIVTVHDFGDVDGLYYFTMEYVDGRNLRDLLQAGALPPAEALAIVPQVCDALQYAHDEGLVHRDIKPENILIDRRGRVKVADFGLARLVGLTPTYLTLTGSQEVMGTLLYMAPEQMKQAHSVDHRADLYSLGVVLYEMLTGELPLGRFAPPSRKAAVNEQLDHVVLRALAREPAERFQDATAFKQEMQAALSAAPVVGSQRPVTPNKHSWPSARFEIRDQHERVTASGLVSRDHETLILEVESAKKRFKSFFKESGKPQELRVPLHDIASLTFGWGWGRPPRSVILKVGRLAALGGMPGSELGRVQLFIAQEDRAAARILFEDLMEGIAASHGPDSVSFSASIEEAQREVATSAGGLLATGILGLFSWLVAGLVLVGFLYKEVINDPPKLIAVVVLGLLVGALASAQIGGALLMRWLRSYPVAATGAILAVIPWSPAWLIGLPYGILAIIALGRPAVVNGFFRAKTAPAPVAVKDQTHGRGPGRGILSLFRSVAGYVLPSRIEPKPDNFPEGPRSTIAS
jgi:serine/threonine protein kinase